MHRRAGEDHEARHPRETAGWGGGDGDMRTKTKTGFQQTCQDKTTIRASQIIRQQKQ